MILEALTKAQIGRIHGALEILRTVGVRIPTPRCGGDSRRAEVDETRSRADPRATRPRALASCGKTFTIYGAPVRTALSARHAQHNSTGGQALAVR